MTLADRTSSLLERLLASPLAKQAEAEIADETRRHRAELVSVLQKCAADRKALDTEFAPRFSKAEAAVSKAVAALQEAESSLRDLRGAHWDRVMSIESAQRKATDSLLFDADPIIAVTIRQLWTLFDKVRSEASWSDHVITLVDGTRLPNHVTNEVTVAARIAQIRTAVSAIEALKLSAEPAGAAIEKILAASQIRRVAGELQ